MRIISYSETQQDTVPVRNIALQDTVPVRNIGLQDSIGLRSDTSVINNVISVKDSVIRKKPSNLKKVILHNIDITAVCRRNIVADITYYHPDHIINKIGTEPINKFPFLFIEKNRLMKADERASLVKHLKPGQALPVKSLHDDWLIGIILLAAFLFSLIRTTSRGMFPGVIKYFLFRGFNDPPSRDIDEIFHWQSTIHNLISFLITGLFVYNAVSYYNIIPEGISGIILWLLILGILISAVTLRHAVCVLTGILSGEKEVFREYLVTVYQFYRIGALFLLLFIILMSYTAILPAGSWIFIGTTVVGMLYLIRIIRLMLIFINRNISIFYLILYLCALEILPVLISVKYFTGLI